MKVGDEVRPHSRLHVDRPRGVVAREISRDLFDALFVVKFDAWGQEDWKMSDLETATGAEVLNG